MRKRMQQRVALFLSFAMAFTSVDSSVLVAASDVTEIVSEETHDHASEEAFLAEEAQPDNAEATAISEEVESVTEADLGDAEEEILGDLSESEGEQVIGDEPETSDVVEETVIESATEVAALEENAEGVTISSISGAPAKEEFITELDTWGISNNTMLEITYSDGSVQTYTIYNDQFVDKYGTVIPFYLKNTEDGNTWRYGHGNSMYQGTWELVCEVNGKAVQTDVTYNVTDVANAEIPVLELGTVSIHSGYSCYNWYQFTAPETGKYYFQKIGGFSVSKKASIGVEGVSSGNGDFRATAGETYYLGFQGTVWNQGTGQNEYDWQTEFSRSEVEITSIDNVIPVKDLYLANIETYFVSGTKVTITYSNGESKTVTWNGNSAYSDGRGNTISMILKTEDSSVGYDQGQTLKAGEYAAFFTVDGKEKGKSGYIYHVKNAKDADLPNLTLGENEINSSSLNDLCNWYQFTAPATGKYRIDKRNDLRIYTGDGTYVTTYGDSFKATAGTTYYIGFRGAIDGSNYTWTANLSSVIEVTEITDIVPGKTETMAGLNYLADGTTFVIHYSNGTSEEAKIVNGTYTDSQGNYIVAIPKRENDDTGYYYWQGVPAGTYAFSLRLDGTVVASTDYIYHVIKPKEVNLPELTVGSNKITSGQNDTYNWYRFTAQTDGKYWFDKCSALKVYVDVKDELQDVYWNGQNFKAEAGKTYYLGFGGSCWDSSIGNETYEWTANLQIAKEITKIADITPKRTEYVFGLDNLVSSGTTFHIYYSDGSVKRATVDGNYYTDGLGNGINMRLISEEDGREYWDWSNLPAGNYALAFYVNKQLAKTEFVYQVKNVEDTEIGELTEGENQIVSSTDSNIPNWYQFVPQHSGNYRINPVSSLSIRKKTENGMESIYSNGSTVSMTAGTTYYLGFSGMWNGGYEWNITIEQIPVITDIQVVKTGKEKYIADLDQGIIRNTELKISYDNGESAIVKIPYGSYFSDNYGNNINAELIKDSKSYNAYGTVPAGSYTLKCRVNNDQTYECEDAYQVADISEVDLPELKPGTVEITSSEDYDNPNWYRFTAPKTKRYVISKYSGIKVKYLSEDGTFEDVSMFDGAFKATYNQTYYIGFYDSIWDDDEEEDIYTWTTELRETNYLTYISVTAKKTKFYAGYEQNHVLLSNIKVRYDGGNLQGYTEWDDWSNIDGQGNGCNVYLTDEEEGQYDVSEALSAGTYTVHIQYREDSSVQDDYIIQVENEPAPFLGDEENVTELSLDEKYRVSLDEDKVCEWFSYTPEKDRIVQFQSFGRKDTYAELYDASGNMIADNDEGGERSNFSIRETLEAGQTYYFKARLYRLEGKASFTVLLTEQQSIQSLEVVEHDLNPVYLKNSDLPEPNVLLKAIYSNEESDTFYKKDKYNNEVWGEVLDASGNQVDTLEEVGTYTYQVRYGEADEQTVKVGEFQVVSLADYAGQVVEEDQEQQIDAADTHVMRYQFTVTDAGIYQLNANVSFKNLTVYDTKENEVKLSRHRNGYTCYATLQEGTYYVVADLNNGVDKLTVSVKKTVLPNSVEAVYSGETLVAGLDSLESWNLATRVKYSDDTQAWIYGEDADSYGNHFEYEITNLDEKYSSWSSFGVGETLPEGTYTVKPVVFRTGTTRWYDPSSENQMLDEVLTKNHITSTTVKSVKPDISAMTPITVDQEVNVTGSAGRYFYAFTPETDGTYTFAYEGAIQGNTFFCDERDNGLRERGNSIKAKAGVTYIVVAEKYKDYQFRIVEKGTDTGETVTKKIRSVEICSEMEYVLEESVYQNRDQLYLCVTYEDETTAFLDVPFYIDGRGEDTYDDYGNKFQYTPAEDEVVEEEEERYLTFGVEYPGGSCATQIPIRDVKEAAIEVTTENAAEAEAASYFKFVPEETGEYIFKTTAQKWGAELGRFTGNKSFTDRNGYENDGTVIQQAVASLQRGKTYYFSVTEYRENNSMPYTLSVSKIEKQVTDLKIVEVPEGYAAYAGIGVPDYNWLKAEVTYSDGSLEIVTEGKVSDTGRSLRVNRSYCVNTDTYRVEVQYGKYRAHVDLPVKAWDYTGVLKTGVAAAGKAGEHISRYSFTPDEKDEYRFGVTGIKQYAFEVYDNETQKMIISRYGTYTLEAGTTYNVAVYNYYSEENEYTVTVNKAETPEEHEHEYVDQTKSATCTEPGYTQKVCSICGAVLEGSRTEIQALGHKLTKTESKEATCTEAGNKAYWTCATCRKVYADENATAETTAVAQQIEALGHNWVETVIEEATDTKDGIKALVCSRCNTEKEGSRVTIPMTAHKMSDWKVTKDATCTEAGSKTRSCTNTDCALCKELGQVYTETETINALGHDMEVTAGYDATCTEDGLHAYWTCKRCDKVFADKDGKTETTPNQQIIPALKHELTEVAAKDATCTTAGNKAYWICDRCKKAFGDQAGDTSVEPKDQIIAAPGHSYDEWKVVAEPTCTEKGSMERTCTKCPYVEAKDVEPTGHNYVTDTRAATCTEEGYVREICARCQSEKEGSKNRIPATGHTFGEWTTTEATCTLNGEKERTCSNCGYVQTEVIQALGHDLKPETKEATCATDGYTQERCSRCNEVLNYHILPALGHDLGDVITTKQPTCTENGKTVQICNRAGCGYKVSGTVEKLEHTFKLDSEAATCTTDGYEREICTRENCGAVQNYKLIPATGHRFGEWRTTKEATCTEAGEQARSCLNSGCAETETQEIPKIEHSWKLTVIKEATETDTGVQVLICEKCKAQKDGSEVEIPVSGHTFGEWTTTEATCTVDGYRERSCTNENCVICAKLDKPYVQKETIPATGHRFGDWTTTKEATCTEAGEQSRSCLNSECVETETQEIPKTEHHYQEDKKEATCTVNGYVQLKCRDCQTIKTDSYQVLPKTGHTYGEGTYVITPTCTSQGLIKTICTSCKAERVTVAPELPHKYEATASVKEEATCTKEGLRDIRCEKCQAVKPGSSETIAKTDHSWKEEYSIDKAATCTSAGQKSIHCAVCDAVKEESITVIPVVAHQYGEAVVTKAATCTADGIKTKVCKYCGKAETETISKTGHKMELKETNAPTCLNDGLMIYTCKNVGCGKIQYAVLGAYGHDWVEQTPVPATDTQNGREYRKCSRCDAEETIRLIASAEQQKKIATVEAFVENPEETGLEQAMESLVSMDEELVTSDLISKMEEKMDSDEEPVIVGDLSEGASVVGGTIAVTTAKAATPQVMMLSMDGLEMMSQNEMAELTELAGMAESAESAKNKISITAGKAGTDSSGKQYQELNICLILATASSATSERLTNLKTPLEITMKAPGNIAMTNFKLERVTTEGSQELQYTANGNGTFTFKTKDLANLRLVAGTCKGEHRVDETTATVTKKATCTTDGEKTAVCSICGETVTVETIPATDHDWKVKKETKATCKEPGTRTYECKKCKEMKQENYTGTHDYEWSVTVQATCTTNGQETMKCTVCGDPTDVRKTISATGHTWGEWKTTKEATCTTKGEQTRICTSCNAKETEPISQTEHHYVTVDEKATMQGCYQQITQKCETCEKTRSIIGTEVKHTPEKVRIEPTCERKGTEVTTCKVCGDQIGETVILPKASHDLKAVEAKSATCTEAGNYAYWTCDTCGKAFTDEAGKKETTAEAQIIKATGHQLTKTEAKAATCTENGNNAYWTCQTCKKVFADENSTTETTVAAQVIAKSGHKLTQTPAKAATCVAEGTRGYWTCGTCGKVFADQAGNIETTVASQVLGKVAHAMGGYVETVHPTALAAGVKTRTCSVCGYAENAEVAKLVSNVKLTTSKLPLQIKQKAALSKIVTGMAEGDYIASAASANKKIATVDNKGNVKGVKAGKTTITLNFASGTSRTVTIAVQKKKVATSKLTVSERNVTLKVKGKRTLMALVSPITSKDKVTYKTSNKKVATVSKKGVITAKKAGKAVITVKAGKKTVKVKVKVTK